MVPTRHASYAARVNFHLAKSLDAEVILVSAPENETLTELTDRIEIQAQLFGGPRDPKVLGVILNKVRGEADAANAETVWRTSPGASPNTRRCCATTSA